MNKFPALIFFLALFNFTYSQEVLENLPPSVKWRQINTPNFKVVFPSNFETEARKVANTLETIHEPESRSLGTKPRKISVILQNGNSVSNGFVSIGPRRSELYTTTTQDYNFIGTNEWLTLLATHEYRHIAQNAHSRQGFTKLMSLIFGQYTQSALSNAAAPQWFWEGDATAIETAYTHSGRGRIPAFDLIFRTNLLEGKRFNYHKQYLRSYKDMVPNHYVLGYHYVNYIRNKTGNANIWGDVTGKAFSMPLIPFTFSNSLKKTTGKYVVGNYEDMMDDLTEKWQGQIDRLDFTAFEPVTRRKKDVFTNYEFPHELPDGRLLVLRSGLGDIPQFVVIEESGMEEVIFTPGVMNYSGTMSVAGNNVVWNEIMYDPRWRKKSYSVIKSLNVVLRKTARLSRNSRFHSASLSAEGSKIATVESTPEGTYNIVILDAYFGNEMKRFTGEHGTTYTVPSLVENDNKVLVIKTTNSGKSVVLIDYATEEESILIDNSYENIGNPFIHNGYLIYHSSYSGIDNIYAMDLSSGHKYQITSSKYGAYNASISNDGKTIFYNDHTVNGLDVVKTAFLPENWKPLNEVVVDQVAYYQQAVDQEGGSDLLDNIPTKAYEVEKYSALKKAVNPHSWGPILSSNISAIEAGILSRDVLSTTSLYGGYVYDALENRGYAVGRLSYQGLYPIIDVQVSYGKRSSSNSTWDEIGMEAGVRLPVLLTKSKFVQNLSVESSVGVKKVSNYKNELSNFGRFNDSVGNRDTIFYDVVTLLTDEIDNGQLLFNFATLNYSALQKRSLKDINSKFGVSLIVESFRTLRGDYQGALNAARGAFYLPGIFKHHSLYMLWGIQSREVNEELDLYSFNNRIYRPRGYSYYLDETASTLMMNYKFPIWYPDVALGPILNIKRLKLNVFYDIGTANFRQFVLDSGTFQRLTVSTHDYIGIESANAKYKSYGVELSMDFNLMRLNYPLEVGIRYVNARANDLSRAASRFELLIGNIGF